MSSISIAPDVDIETEHNRLYNADLAPVPGDRRKWRVGSFAALWISMSACIPTYMLASSLIGGGMNWSQAIFTIFLGNLIVVIPMILNAHAGTRYGIPFPVFCRASFGTRGANIPALMRAFVACGWFGIQTWIGGNAIYKIMSIFAPGLATGSTQNFLGITFAQFVCFMFFCFVFFVPALTGMIGFWATLSLNIPDFSRYACSQRDQIIGQALGLPLTMALYSFIGVAVTSATTIIYGQTIWDPVDVLTHFTNPIVLVVAMLALCIATLATNIAANVVSPANDFSHVAPQKISFRIGGLITGIVGIIMIPWKLVADPNGYIFTWLVGYSALLGPIGGIMIADYYVLRRRQLHLGALYRSDGEYRYTNGFSIVAIVALIVAILPNLPGFLVTVKLADPAKVPAFFVRLYDYAWFVGFAIAFVAYLLLRKLARPT